jgi:hypothetical protein
MPVPVSRERGLNGQRTSTVRHSGALLRVLRRAAGWLWQARSRLAGTDMPAPLLQGMYSAIVPPGGVSTPD